MWCVCNVIKLRVQGCCVFVTGLNYAFRIWCVCNVIKLRVKGCDNSLFNNLLAQGYGIPTL